MINEEQILKDAISYLSAGLAEHQIPVYPKNQKKPARFPCVVLTVTSQVSVDGIYDELLANVQIHATVYSNNIYAPQGSVDGIHTIFDMLNVLMGEKHYRRSNQTEPYFNVGYDKWNKDGYFTKRTNEF